MLWFNNTLVELEQQQHHSGLFLDPTIPSSFLQSISLQSNNLPSPKPSVVGVSSRRRRRIHNNNKTALFLSVSLNGTSSSGIVGEDKVVVENEEEDEEEAIVVEKSRNTNKLLVVRPGRGRGRDIGRGGAMNTTMHLWAGAVAAMVSRTCVAPLERLKLEYIVRGEQKNLIQLVSKIAKTQGLRGFWKGNLINILRTAPFKAINFTAYDTYRKRLLLFSGNEETTNFERFVAGAAAGMTATVLCLPLDTIIRCCSCYMIVLKLFNQSCHELRAYLIRTKIVAHGGEALGGVIGAFNHMVQTEGFFSLYKGLVPSILSMAPSGAVFYSVYDILKSAYLHSPEGRKRIENMKQDGLHLNAFDQLELGPSRTLLYGAIAGACAEFATYPFEVVRRKLQLQVQANRLSALATCAQIVEQGGVPALYAGLVPSLLQVLPSAAISYFVYECMKIILKVE
ncbi:hypothetical protein ACFE04_013618 [Oxalis oulophora]